MIYRKYKLRIVIILMVSFQKGDRVWYLQLYITVNRMTPIGGLSYNNILPAVSEPPGLATQLILCFITGIFLEQI